MKIEKKTTWITVQEGFDERHESGGTEDFDLKAGIYK